MCTGAVRGFARLKFSTSPIRLGQFEFSIINSREIVSRGYISFRENAG